MRLYSGTSVWWKSAWWTPQLNNPWALCWSNNDHNLSHWSSVYPNVTDTLPKLLLYSLYRQNLNKWPDTDMTRHIEINLLVVRRLMDWNVWLLGFSPDDQNNLHYHHIRVPVFECNLQVNNQIQHHTHPCTCMHPCTYTHGHIHLWPICFSNGLYIVSILLSKLMNPLCPTVPENPGFLQHSEWKMAWSGAKWNITWN